MTAADLVVKIGGRCFEDRDSIDALAAELASLAKTGVRLVLVHGGGASLDRRLERLGIETKRVGGLRLTPPEVLEEAVAVYAGIENKRLVAALEAAGVRAAGITGVDGGSVTTEFWKPDGLDAGRVGRVTGGDATLLRALLGAGFVPVVAPIALGPDGGLVNVNADEIAAGIARLLRAPRLFLLSDVEGVRDASGATVERLDEEAAERAIASGTIRDGMVPKVRAALDVARASGARVFISSGRAGGSLRRLAAGERVGTIVEASP